MITKNNPSFENLAAPDGDVILFDKPLHWSSFKVIYYLRKNSSVKKAGHAGTLDPLATGLLIVCSGRMTKQICTYQDSNKEYIGSFELGKTTASMDAETPVLEEKSITHVTPELIYEAARSLSGEQLQVPPMYSATNFQGKKLYQLARKGKVVHREPRRVMIHDFTITEITLPIVKFIVSCSKGVYIRTLAHDLGQLLGCGAYLTELRRTKIGDFNVTDAFTPEEFKSAYEAGINPVLVNEII
jgi:tRNA pseudouridine55 synthase